MIPVLFAETATEFTTQGIGALADAISCEVTEERNGMYELEMEYPITGIHFEDIQYRAIICAIPSPYRRRQPFRIYKISRPLDGVVTIYAAHLSYDLNGIPVSPFNSTGIANTFGAIKSRMEIDNNFSFIPGITNATSVLNLELPTACRTVLGGMQGSVLDIYGGEYEWDVWTIRLWAKRGANNGVTVRYGKNMTKLEAETNGENVVTGIYPYWSKDGVTVTCDPKIIWADNIGYQKSVPVDFSNDFDEQPTPAQLKTRAVKYIEDNNIGTLPTSITVSFVQLSQLSGYEDIAALEECDLCDTVTVQYEALGVDLEAEIVSETTDVLQERYVSMQVGTIRADVAQTIADTSNKVDKVVRPDGSLVAEALRGFINGSLVNLYAQYDAATPASEVAVFFERNDETDPLFGALAIGTQGILISKKKKSDGTGWDWTTALSFEGLMAGIIIAGILTDKTGENYWNLDTGEFVAGNATVQNNASGDSIRMRNAQMQLFRKGTEVGFVGTNNITGDENFQGLVFDLEDTGDYMSWAYKESPEDAAFTMIMTWARQAKLNLTAGMNFWGPINFHNGKLSNFLSSDGYTGATGKVSIITSIESQSGGGIKWWESSFTVRDGIVTSIPASSSEVSEKSIMSLPDDNGERNELPRNPWIMHEITAEQLKGEAQ